MTLADDPQNQKPQKKLAKSLDALAALREAMEQRLDDNRQEQPSSDPTPPPPTPDAEQTTAQPDKPAAENPPKPEPSASSESEPPAYDPVEWSRIVSHVAERSQKLMMGFVERNKANALQSLPFDPARASEALLELTGRIVNDPQRYVDAQIALWQGYIKIWQTTLARVQGQPVPDEVTPAPNDRRFQDKEWQTNWLFDMFKQFYLLTAFQVKDLVQSESRKLNHPMARKIEFFTQQMIDAASPSNFWMTNPEVLRTIYQSGGESLVKGFENLLADLETGKGDLRIRMTDMSAFRLGQNIATTPGRVIYQNELMQLIQYAPTTPQVHRAPVLIIPPWINKYYILDLSAKKSFIAWMVAQGYTVFCVSWVNPDGQYAAVSYEDYMTQGALAAMRETAKATGETSINAVGYCIGGTLLASTLAYLAGLQDPPHDIPTIRSVTYFATMTDFSEPGDLGAFIDEDLVRMAEERMEKQGYLDAATMGTVFNLLRSNDLIWSYVVNNYLLGKDPSAFDILYWNTDSTNMPAAMQRYYIREMYVANKLIQPFGLTLKNVPIDLRKIRVPSHLVSTREDHIAPWKSTYAATQVYGGPVRFTLAGSGHIAGIINPPASGKYGYWTNDACPSSSDDWLKEAEEHKGSWWPEWLKWLESYSGEMIAARAVPAGLEPAPGSYVKVRAV